MSNIVTIGSLNPKSPSNENPQQSILKLTEANEKLSNLTEKLALKVQDLLEVANTEHNQLIMSQATISALMQENEALRNHNKELMTQIHTITPEMESKMKEMVTQLFADKLKVHDAQIDAANQNVHNLQANQELIRQEMNQRIATLDAERKASENATKQRCDAIEASTNNQVNALKEQMSKMDQTLTTCCNTGCLLAMSLNFMADELYLYCNLRHHEDLTLNGYKVTKDYLKDTLSDIERDLIDTHYLKQSPKINDYFQTLLWFREGERAEDYKKIWNTEHAIDFPGNCRSGYELRQRNQIYYQKIISELRRRKLTFEVQTIKENNNSQPSKTAMDEKKETK